MDFGMILNSLTISGLAGIFLVGMLSRLADSRAIWAGIVCNMLFSGYALLSDRGLLPESLTIPFDLYYTAIVGNTITILVSILMARFVWRTRRTDFTNLTVWDQDKKPLV